MLSMERKEVIGITKYSTEYSRYRYRQTWCVAFQDHRFIFIEVDAHLTATTPIHFDIYYAVAGVHRKIRRAIPRNCPDQAAVNKDLKLSGNSDETAHAG